MSSSAEKIVENFPHPTIQPIVGQPTYESLAELHLKLNANAASVHSNRGNGQFGLIYLTLKGEVYATLSAVPFVPPDNPGQNPTVPAGSTAAQITEIRRAHKEAMDEFNTYTNTDKALKSLLIAAVDETYIRAKRHKFVGYANITTKELLEHLYTSYAQITSNDLRENEARMNQPYDPNQPIEILFDQIDDAVDFAAAGNVPYTNRQIVIAAYNLVFDTGVFGDECKEWRKLEPANKTWAQFKRMFTVAHQDLQESRATARTTGYANNATQEVEALEAITQLANATTADRSTIASLTQQVQRLQEENSNLQAKLVAALEKLAVAGVETKPKRKRKKHYCWSCGSNSNHKGENCRNKKSGHQDSATEANKMGGSTHRFN